MNKINEEFSFWKNGDKTYTVIIQGNKEYFLKSLEKAYKEVSE